MVILASKTALAQRSFALSRRKQGFESPRERQRTKDLGSFGHLSVPLVSRRGLGPRSREACGDDSPRQIHPPLHPVPRTIACNGTSLGVGADQVGPANCGSLARPC